MGVETEVALTEEPDDRTAAPSGGSVLVVDDDPFIARLLEIELKAAGYDVRVANDGEQALGLAREVCPELVLADVMMPNMDGFELTRRLRQDPRTATVSIIMLTARGLSADKLEGFAIGADDYIVKPFDTPELLARIRGVLRRAKEMRAQSPLTSTPRLTIHTVILGWRVRKDGARDGLHRIWLERRGSSRLLRSCRDVAEPTATLASRGGVAAL